MGSGGSVAFSDAARQRDGLSQVARRPWPLPERSWFMGQSWRHLLFAHWPVDVEEIARVIPPQIPLDLYEGRAWLGITPFRVDGFRLRGVPPVPGLSRFCEVNVRTYVELEGKPGIYFLSLDAASRLAVGGARRSYRLPYFHAAMSLDREADGWRMRSTRVSSDGPAAQLDCRYGPAGERFQAAPGSLEHWLTERYCLYTLAGESLQRGEIHHPPWPLQPAKAEIAANTMADGFGLRPEGEPLLHYADRQDVVLWSISPLEQS